jgi:hypothetical protein
MPLYISELSPDQLTHYHQTFYKKIDYALRTGRSCFANLVSLSMEEIDAMEIGGFPAYYARRPLYDRPPDAQIQAQRAAKRAAKQRRQRLQTIKQILLEEGPKSSDLLVERMVELVGMEFLQDDLLLCELVGWVEGESGLLQQDVAAVAAAVACSEFLQTAEEAAPATLTEVCCSELPAAAAAEEIVEEEIHKNEENKEKETDTERVEEIALPAAAEVSCSELPATPTPTYEELWPALPPRSCRQLPAAAAAKPKDVKGRSNTPGDLKKVGKQEQTPRQRRSRIQGYIQNPSLLKGLPMPALVMQPLFPSSK